jgi:hypothetical protein
MSHRTRQRVVSSLVRFFFFFSFSFPNQLLQNLIYAAEIGTTTTTMTTDDGKPLEVFAATTFRSPPEDKHPRRSHPHPPTTRPKTRPTATPPQQRWVGLDRGLFFYSRHVVLKVTSRPFFKKSLSSIWVQTALLAAAALAARSSAPKCATCLPAD